MDVISEIPSYGKIFKELISKKRKVDEVRTVNLSQENSAILLSKLPPKLEDPGSFSIPYSIQGIKINKALCDLGASVSLMPLSFFKHLKLTDFKPTKLLIPCDFFVMDTSEDHQVPIILGRPCLAMGGAMIDVKSGKLSLQVGKDKVEFELLWIPGSGPNSTSCAWSDLPFLKRNKAFPKRGVFVKCSF
ncbi:hypothetical protein RND81_09G044500 [Saponaria officinalis]|uniref:Aspartic peptidase DDI1-type domain-containing protein n=1 Tax=Saponaria officinalis TaxID=3572 RepID=A0AAW1IIK6_SAPOF